MSRTLQLACALALAGALGCPATPATPTAGKGLRVPLSDGWVATPVGDRLEAGPPGRVALLLESKTVPLPTADALAAAATADGAQRLIKESQSNFIMVRYSLASDAGALAAFLAVRQVGARTVWCASTAAARAADVEEAISVCRSLSTEDR